MTYEDKHALAHPLAISLFLLVFFTYGFFYTFKLWLVLMVIVLAVTTFLLARAIFVAPVDIEEVKRTSTRFHYPG